MSDPTREQLKVLSGAVDLLNRIYGNDYYYELDKEIGIRHYCIADEIVVEELIDRKRVEAASRKKHPFFRNWSFDN